MTDSTLSAAEIEAANLADWRRMFHALQARFRTGSYAAGLRLVSLIGAAAEEADHHPDLDLRYGHLNVRLASHDAGGVTQRDIRLARRISELAAEVGATAQPQLVAALEVVLDTPDYARIKPFWLAVLGYRASTREDDEVQNDDAGLPAMWFQASGADEPRQRFHIDVMVPQELAEERIAAAVAAGGTVLNRESVFTVLADPDGNKVCVCI